VFFGSGFGGGTAFVDDVDWVILPRTACS